MNFLFGALLCALAIRAEASFVDPNVVLQSNFKGWGTSLAWWADMVGGMDDDIVEYVMDALFSPSKLNLNIVRYVIGGTDPNYHSCGDYRPGAASEQFLDGLNMEYNWTRDPRQSKILEVAKAKGANVFEAFSNSPPQWLTIMGCSKGNSGKPPLHSNFESSNSDKFADYATEVIKYFHEKRNITFTTYSPFNEPYGLYGIGSWVGQEQQQEGCNMDRPTMVSVIKSVAEAKKTKGLDFLNIAVSDETQVNTQIGSYNSFIKDGVGNLFSQVNVHGYWEEDLALPPRKDLLSLKCSAAGHELWMDEMGWGGSTHMGQALNLATRVVADLNEMLPSAWVYWQVVEDNNGWGLLDVPYADTTIDKIVINSGYYAMQQFSQHIKQGYQLISVSDKNSVAAFNPEEKKLVIVTLNPTGAVISQEFDLNLFKSIGTVELFRTSAEEHHTSLTPPSVSSGNRVTIKLASESISTLEFSGVELLVQENLLVNGDFESEKDAVLTGWEIIGDGPGFTKEEAWRGTNSGMLETRNGIYKALRQNFTVPTDSPSPCNIYLSAWCSATQSGTTLNITLNEELVSVTNITGTSAYSSYSLALSANASDIIQISFENPGTVVPGTAKIDNVVLHLKCGIVAEPPSTTTKDPTQTDPPADDAAAAISATKWFWCVLILATLLR